MNKTRSVTGSLLLLPVGALAAMVLVSACSAAPGAEPEASGTASEANTGIHSVQPALSLWQVATGHDTALCHNLQDNVPIPPELAGQGCTLGAAQAPLIGHLEPVWACPVGAAIKHQITTTGFDASTLWPCNVSNGLASLPYTRLGAPPVTSCAVVLTGAPANPCYGNLDPSSGWEFVWQHAFTSGPDCDSMGCGGPCPVTGYIPH